MRGPFPVSFDRPGLTSLSPDPDAYGTALTEQLFADAVARRELVSICDGALETGALVRIRLNLQDLSLHQLHWELLRDPARDTPLALDRRLLLTRFVSAERRGRVVLRPRGQLRALAAAAGPAELEQYGLASIDAGAELARVQAALGEISVDLLGGAAERCSLDALTQQLWQEPGYDILYLIAHGALVDAAPFLYLETRAGKLSIEPGSRLAAALEGLAERLPKLVVLASCASGSYSDAGALASLGPLLAQLGVPAVLAMQGRMSLATMERFAPSFFREMLRGGVADQALAAARLAVRDQPDWWMPVLYTRLRDGRIWNSTTAPSWAASPPTVDRTLLRQLLIAHYSLEELIDLGFDLGIDHELLAGSTKTAKARELILYCERRDRIAELVQRACSARPQLAAALTGAAQG